MELDKRILEGKKPFDCVDAESETVKSFIGKKGYFANHISEFIDISDLEEDVLTGINPDEPDCEVYKATCTTWEYFLPKEWVKEEKKYRPYKNVQELFDDVGCYIGDVIHFRSKSSKETEHHALITSYITLKSGTEKLCLGGTKYYYTMQELFDLFELHSRGEWLAFGKQED